MSPELRQWLYVLKNMQNFDEADYDRQDGIFKILLDECRISKLSDMEKEEYQKSVLEYEDVQDALEYAKEYAAQEGFEQGIKQGLKDGIVQGCEQTKVSIARNMIKKGFDIQTISGIIGLTEAEIQELLK